MTPAELLEEAAEKIRQPGLWQRRSLGYGGVDDPHCAVGWLLTLGGGWHNDFMRTACDALMGELGFRNVAYWNDVEAKDENEVADVMLRTAKRLRDHGEIL